MLYFNITADLLKEEALFLEYYYNYSELFENKTFLAVMRSLVAWA